MRTVTAMSYMRGTPEQRATFDDWLRDHGVERRDCLAVEEIDGHLEVADGLPYRCYAYVLLLRHGSPYVIPGTGKPATDRRVIVARMPQGAPVEVLDMSRLTRQPPVLTAAG